METASIIHFCNSLGSSVFLRNMISRKCNLWNSEANSVDFRTHTCSLTMSHPDSCISSKYVGSQLNELYVSESPNKSDICSIVTILKACPRIQVLRHESLVAALYIMHKNHEESELPVYQLKNLDVNFSYHGAGLRNTQDASDAISLAIQLCPFAERFQFILGQLTPEQVLRHLSAASTVSEFIIQRDTYMSFNVELYSFLDSHGKSVKCLQISNFWNLNLDLVVQRCPLLTDLYLLKNSYEFSADLNYASVLCQNLKIVTIVRGTNIPSYIWKCILASNNTAELYLNSSNVPSALIQELIRKNYWGNLRVFCVKNCKHISVDDIIMLVSCCGNLGHVDLTDCERIGRQEYGDIYRYIKSQKLAVTVNSSRGNIVS